MEKMNNNFLFKQEFEEWLIKIEGLTKDSAKSYLSYISGANKLILVSRKGSVEKTSLFTLLETECKKQNYQSIGNALSYVITELSRLKADKTFNRPIKTLQNYKSGLNSYLIFLSEQPFSIFNYEDINQESIESEDDTINIFTETENIIPDSNNALFFSKDDLTKNFSLRIKTQDRFYEKIFFPIRFITRVFSLRNQNAAYRKWLSDLLDSIIIFLENGQTTFSEIKSLCINNGQVSVNLEGSNKIVYTKLSDNKSLMPFEIDKLKEISIDHSFSLFEVLNSNLESLPTIIDISKKLKDHIPDKVTYANLCQVSHSDILNDYIDKINTDSLLKELYIISSKTNLQLMDRSQNTSKGKK